MREHKERIRHDLIAIRQEVRTEVLRIPVGMFGWAPAPGMKPYRDIILEIGVMERESRILLETGRVPGWQPMWDSLSESAERPDLLLNAMDEDRSALLAYLFHARDSDLQATLLIPADWQAFFGTEAVEREELLRWIVRHEYYHLGQIITYNWLRGDDPYKRAK